MSYSNFDEFPKALGEDDPLLIGNWKILHIIGVGGMGKVYEGVAKNHTKSAIKIINSETITNEYLARFKKEIRAMNLINSMYVAKIYDSNANSELPYMAIEYIHGKTLEKMIENKEEISERLWFSYAWQLFQGLKAVHSRGLTHRDIKPKNIMKLFDREILKIIDFGLVRGDDTKRTNRTQLVGTFPYMSPEQLKFITPTQKSDVFSAGITLVELFTKKHPFSSTKITSSIENKIIEDEPNLEGLSQNQIDICQRMLEKNPAERASSTEISQRISEILETYRKKFRVPAKKIAKKAARKPKVVKANEPTKDPVLVGLSDEFNLNKTPIVHNLIKMTVASNVIATSTKHQKEISNLGLIAEKVLNNLNNKVFHLDFYSRSLGQNVYFQGYLDDNKEFIIEAESNNFLDNKLSDQKVAKVFSLGWNPPESDLPNYYKKYLANENSFKEISKLVALTAFEIYGATEQTEFYLSPFTDKVYETFKANKDFYLKSDGTFKLRVNEQNAKNSYIDWQIIGIFERKSQDYFVLTDVFARHRINNQVHKRSEDKWKFLNVDPNPIATIKKDNRDKFGYIFSKSIIALFDLSKKKNTPLSFSAIEKYLDMIPVLPEKFQIEEQSNPLVDEMVIEDRISLFTLFTSEPQLNSLDPANSKNLGLFAKHPITNNYYARKNGKWKILFEDPTIYGYTLYPVSKKAIRIFDLKTKDISQPINYEDLEPHFLLD